MGEVGKKEKKEKAKHHIKVSKYNRDQTQWESLKKNSNKIGLISTYAE